MFVLVEREKLYIQIFTDPNLNVVRKIKKVYVMILVLFLISVVKCNIPWKNISIAIHNDVYFDCRSDFKHFGKFETIEKSWNGLAIQNIRQSIIDENYIDPCEDCSILC
jgi:hypothetical protein